MKDLIDFEHHFKEQNYHVMLYVLKILGDQYFDTVDQHIAWEGFLENVMQYEFSPNETLARYRK